ncbi:CapA family protein [uncultured Helicobacter sp.]|uniref:CapA family protein n=3 Tax=uncultured Helicobacter sp. TaxID=175537 RepID=UPI0025D544F4|nr:CapA family protein [uncultured Helicobacter sp.]
MKHIAIGLLYICLSFIYSNAKELDLIMAGDALLHASVYNDAKQANETYDFSTMLSALKPIVAKYDLAFYNQETILGGSALGLSTYPAFNSPQEFGDNMLSLGFNLVSLANNHTLDRGEATILASLKYWADKPALTAGSYSSFKERNTFKILEKNGIKYTLLAYTYGTNGIPLPKGKEYLVNVYTKAMLENDIKQVRDKVDLLIVSMHWGIEYDFTPSQEQYDLAKLLADLGVDLIIGTHPHVVQKAEWIGDSLVYYSLGNLISGQKDTNKRIGMLGSVHITKIKNGKVKLSNPRAELIYTYYDARFKNFKLMWFNEINEKILSDYQNIYRQYTDIITQGKDEIQIGL